MAKKVVATLKTATGKDWAKVIKAVKSPKTGAYTFKEEMVPVDKVQEFLAANNYTYSILRKIPQQVPCIGTFLVYNYFPVLYRF